MNILPREIINNIVSFTEPVNLNYYSILGIKVVIDMDVIILLYIIHQ